MHSGKPGLALVFVLGMVAVLATLLTLVLNNSILLMRDQAWLLAQRHTSPKSPEYVDIAIATINEIASFDGGLYSPVQGWDDVREWALPAVRIPEHITISISDETSRIGLQNPTQQTLIALFESLGIDFDTRQQLADCFLDWIDADDETRLHGAEDNEYRRESPDGPRPPNRALTSFDELRDIAGFTPLFFTPEGQLTELGRRLKDSVSIHHQSPVNLNTASKTVLESLFPERSFEIETFLRERDGNTRRSISSNLTYWKSIEGIAAYLPDASPRLHGVSPRILRITIIDSSGDFPVVREFLAQPSSASSNQWTIHPL